MTSSILEGTKACLRARLDADVALLDAGLYDDVETRARADNRPWVPRAPGSSESPYAVVETSSAAAHFSVVSTADSDDLIGEALLWDIDTHNRSAHIGLSLLPEWRGQGLGKEVLELLGRYAFEVRGLHRLQLETAADNAAMIGAAESTGFTHEGVLREASWALGKYLDQVIFGLLASEWSAR